MVRHATFFMLVITAVALAPRRVCAQQSVTLQWENDVLFRSDDDYTNGLRVSADLDKALWWKRWGLGYNNCRDEDKSKPCLRTTLMFGQNFYTPQTSRSRRFRKTSVRTQPGCTSASRRVSPGRRG
jgi:hypothetical protein